MDARTSLELHFYDQDRIAVCLECFALSEPNTKVAEVLTYANLALRHISNFGQGPIAESIAIALINAGDAIEEIERFGKVQGFPGPVDYSGNPARKRFICSMLLSEAKDKLDFTIKLKGFGMFDKSLNYYAPVSLMVLLRKLCAKRANDRPYLLRLGIIAAQCGVEYQAGSVRIADHHQLAYGLTKTIFDTSDAQLLGDQRPPPLP